MRVDCCWGAFADDRFPKSIDYFKKECWRTVYGTTKEGDDD